MILTDSCTAGNHRNCWARDLPCECGCHYSQETPQPGLTPPVIPDIRDILDRQNEKCDRADWI